jgi:predicted phosphodiesterase
MKCREFQSYRALQAVFVTEQLFPFRIGLPSANSPEERVSLLLDYLIGKRLSSGHPVLPVFLATLRDRYEPGDALRDDLDALYRAVQSAMAPQEPRPSQPPHHNQVPFDSSALSTAARPHPFTPTQRPETITWLHLSDLHFRESRTYDENIVLQALLRDIAERIQTDGPRPDLVTVTGDIVFSGKQGEYDLARLFFDKLLTTTGLPRERLFVVPGNHDVDRDLITAGAKAIGASLTDRDSVNTLLTTPGDRRLVLARFKGYKEFVNDYFAGHLAFDDEHYFYVQELDLSGRRIALLGLNSAWLCASDQDKEQKLVIGERQARMALDTEQATGAELKIALLHHPFDWLREFDQNDSAAMLLDNCDFVLHGHLHHTAMAQLVSPDSGAMVIASGACYETRQYPNSYNFVRLDLSAETGTVYLRRYSDARGGFWAKDTLTYRNVPDGEYPFALHNPTPP